jgi:hypothetical protein
VHNKIQILFSIKLLIELDPQARQNGVLQKSKFWVEKASRFEKSILAK